MSNFSQARGSISLNEFITKNTHDTLLERGYFIRSFNLKSKDTLHLTYRHTREPYEFRLRVILDHNNKNSIIKLGRILSKLVMSSFITDSLEQLDKQADL